LKRFLPLLFLISIAANAASPPSSARRLGNSRDTITPTTPVVPLTSTTLGGLAVNPAITASTCPVGTLPQYCAQVSGAPPVWSDTCAPATPLYQCIQAGQQNQFFAQYNCSSGNFACVTQQQAMQAQGCPSGAFQSTCMAQLYTQPSLLAAQQQAQQQQQQQQMAALAPLMQMMQPKSGVNPNSTMSGGNTPRELASSGGGGGGNNYSGGGGSAGEYTTIDKVNPQSERGYASIVNPMKESLPKCFEKLKLGNCAYKDEGIWPSKEHMAKNPTSCHNNGTAMDLGFPMKCTGGVVVQPNDPRAKAIATCLAQDFGGKFKVIYQDMRGQGFTVGNAVDHKDHIHVKLSTCPG
jgi:hypothetical protein